MGKVILTIILAAFLGIGGLSYAQTKARVGPAGVWSGSWTGGSGGKFEITIRRETQGRFSGSMTVSPDRGDEYAAQIRTIVSKGGNLSLTFWDPEGEVEVTLQGSIAGASYKGDYTIRARVSGKEVEKGAFTASRK